MIGWVRQDELTVIGDDRDSVILGPPTRHPTSNSARPDSGWLMEASAFAV